jgi:hypothetical protein
MSDEPHLEPGREEPPAAHEHVAEPPVAGAGHELIAARERRHAINIRRLGRFRWATAALFLLAACSLAAAVVLSSNHTSSSGSDLAWSVWKPPDAGLAGAQEIADYVAPNYEASPPQQLAIVTTVNLNNPTAPVQVVVPASSNGGGLVPLPASSTIVYNLCGTGSPDCSIGTGRASALRLLLLRREALELALYTFKYLTGTQNVVAVLPRGYASSQCLGLICAKPPQKPVKTPSVVAVAFDRAELQPWLSQPLRATLPESLAPPPGQMPPVEAELVRVITAHGLFSVNTAQGQDGSTVMTLNPLPPQ